MRTAIYPGSFNPWHEGHQDVLDKALKTFDKVIIAVGINPEKDTYTSGSNRIPDAMMASNVVVLCYKTLLVEFIKSLDDKTLCAVVKGLRDGKDLDYERVQQYYNEDLGIQIPTVYFITDRKLVHISSSAIRAVNNFKGSK